ncbi:MAG: homoaconitate hydratase, partial [Desulfuromonadales bacterium]|nr:homoaconitate hydratase [Desulfuromonadales bacterium]
YDPAEVGLSRHIVIGKHSGRHGLQDRLSGLGIDLDRLEADSFLARVRNIAQRRKRPLSDHDLLRLYDADRKVA